MNSPENIEALKKDLSYMKDQLKNGVQSAVKGLKLSNMSLSGILMKPRFLINSEVKVSTEEAANKLLENNVTLEIKEEPKLQPMINNPLKKADDSHGIGTVIQTLVNNFAESKESEEENKRKLE